MSGIVRDFSLSSIEHLREIIRENMEEDGELFLVDWVKDWFMDDLNIEDYINDIDTYHANMVDKYDISYKKFDEILNKLHAVDISYADRFNSIYEGLSSFNAKIMNVTAIIDPSAVTLDENVYEELLDGLETLYTNDLTKVKNTIDNDESELNESLREVPWYESALDFVAGAGVELVKNNLEGLVFIPYAIVDGIFGTNLNENLDLLLNNAEEKYILPHIGNKQAYYYGKATGDVITMIEGAYGIAKGLFKIVSGLGLAGGGFVLEASGVGVIFGAAAQAVSIPLVVAGTAEMSLALAVAAEGYGNFNDNMMMASSSSNINDSIERKQKDLESDLKNSSGRVEGESTLGKTKYDNIKLDSLSEEQLNKVTSDIRCNGGSPIEIPYNAVVKAQSKKAGYEQISYKWSDGKYTYEARWHTETPGAAKYDRGTTWVVNRTIPGNANGVQKVVQVKVGDKWIDNSIWQQAVRANQKGIATQEQMNLLEKGHWLAK